MITRKSKGLEIRIRKEDGLICGLYSGFGAYNIADPDGMGSVCYTLRGDDIRTERPLTPYEERFASYDSIIPEKDRVRCRNEKLSIDTAYTLGHDRLLIESHTKTRKSHSLG